MFARDYRKPHNCAEKNNEIEEPRENVEPTTKIAPAPAPTTTPTPSTTAPAMSPVDLSKIVPGSDAYWAMDDVRKALKSRVTKAKNKLEKLKKSFDVNSTSYWSAKGKMPPIFARAAMIYLPGKQDFSEQFRREFRAFFMSWIVLRTKQPENFRCKRS